MKQALLEQELPERLFHGLSPIPVRPIPWTEVLPREDVCVTLSGMVVEAIYGRVIFYERQVR